MTLIAENVASHSDHSGMDHAYPNNFPLSNGSTNTTASEHNGCKYPNPIRKVATTKHIESTAPNVTTKENFLLYKDFKDHPGLVIESGSGIYLNVRDGRRILDATSGAAVACLGYSNSEVQKAVVSQLLDAAYCHPGFYKTDVAEQLAELLISSTNGQMSKAVLTGSGMSETSIAMIKLIENRL